MASYDVDNPRMRERIVAELWRWVETHPRRGEVVVATMTDVDEPERTDRRAQLFDPADYARQVEWRTPFGESFVAFLVRQANRHDEAPEAFIRRAVLANEAS